MGEEVVGAAVGDVEGGVRGVDGDAAADGVVDDGVGGDVLDGLEEGRVVGDDGVAAEAVAFGGDGGGVVDGEEDLGDGVGGVAGEEADVVPGFGVAGGGDGFHGGDEVGTFIGPLRLCCLPRMGLLQVMFMSGDVVSCSLFEGR